MSIIRVVHNQENPYVQINKKALWDDSLSLKARGLWACCLSRPDNWTFSVKEMIKSTKEGKTALYSALNELIDQGYALKFQLLDSNSGQFEKVEYVFFEFKLDNEQKAKFIEEFKKCLPCSGFPRTENEPLLIKNNTSLISTQSYIPKTIKTYIATPKLDFKFCEIGKYVKLKQPDLDRLNEKYGIEKIKQVCEEINDYLSAHGKKPYSDFAAAIRNWIRKDEKAKADKISKPVSPQNESNKGLNIKIIKSLIESLARRYERDALKSKNILLLDNAFVDKNINLTIPFSMETSDILKKLKEIYGFSCQIPEIKDLVV